MVIDNAYEVPLCTMQRVHTNLPEGIRAEREAYVYQVIIKRVASLSAYASHSLVSPCSSTVCEWETIPLLERFSAVGACCVLMTAVGTS